jgi:MYXO-CTERM domain-containing protein
MFPLDQAGDSFVLGRYPYYCSGADLFNIVGIASAAFRGSETYRHFAGYVSKLSFGQRIPRGHFTQAPYGGVLASAQNGFNRGQWLSPGYGFIGFSFNNGAGVQYGWARIRMSGVPQLDFKLLDYAYADPGEPIRAGQISSDEQAPDQGSLGWLALGALGLLAWRKSRSRTAS